MTKPIMKYGQLHADAKAPYRRAASAPKRLTVPAPTHGARRVTKPSHEFLHGAPINDEPNVAYSDRRYQPVKIHPAMTAKQVAKAATAPSAKDVLDEASRLGAPIGGFKR